MLRLDNAHWTPRFPGDVRRIPPDAATEAELQELEAGHQAELPSEYRQFLLRARYYCPIQGCWVHGAPRRDEENANDCSAPWLSDSHLDGRDCWVIGDYFRYADGDQLLIFLYDPSQKVMLYLHEDGPLFEVFAPSFSLALWRVAFERYGYGT